MSNNIQVNDIGTQFIVSIFDSDSNIIDISNASELYIVFKKPSGEVLTKTATFYTDGTDGKLDYTTIDGDLDEIGSWKIQANIVAPNGDWRTTFISFRVNRNIS